MTDLFLQAWVASLIRRARRDHLRARSLEWRPGEPLRLLFVGYNGARNTGSDVRVEEMLRQIRRVLGVGRVRLAVLTQNSAWTRGYFGDAVQIRLPDIFPPFLHREIPSHHGVVACEGSMFKSRFANALTAMMIEALGISAARNKLSVGYGAEAGEMSRSLRWMVRAYCSSSLVITRNEESGKILRSLRVRTEPGTDTAWTFEPRDPEAATRVLRRAGWDGEVPLLGICPIHPFWWPVKASLAKLAARRLFGAFREDHYRSVYFHTGGARGRRAFERYLEAIARAVRAFGADHRVFPVLFAMERLDMRACRRLGQKLGGCPIFGSEEHDMYVLVSLLRQCDLLVSSRYHGIVTTMPALVPSAGITMDERIRNLMHERGHEDLLMEVDDPQLEDHLYDALEQMWHDKDVFRAGIGRSVMRHLRAMARMGFFFEQEVARRFPEFETRSGLASWEDYLPPLGPRLRQLVERFQGEEETVPVGLGEP